MHPLRMTGNICNSLVGHRWTGAAIVKIKLKMRMKGKVMLEAVPQWKRSAPEKVCSETKLQMEREGPGYIILQQS